MCIRDRDILPLHIAVYHLGHSLLVAQITDNDRHIRALCQLTGPIPSMAIYDFITSLRVRANKRGLTYTTRLYTGNKPDHRRVLIPH